MANNLPVRQAVFSVTLTEIIHLEIESKEWESIVYTIVNFLMMADFMVFLINKILF